MTAQAPAVDPGETTVRSGRLGAIAFAAGVVVFVGSVIDASIIGVIVRTPPHYNPPAETLPYSFLSAQASATVGYLLTGVLVLGTGLGIWAIVQGIVASVQVRGRRWAMAAIILGVAAPLLSFVAFLVLSA
jgi:hypothetical protein